MTITYEYEGALYVNLTNKCNCNCDFCLRHAEFAPRTVREDKGSMEDSYLMVAPDGRVLLNHRGVYQDYGSCLQVPFAAIAARLPLDRAKYAARYGEEVRA